MGGVRRGALRSIVEPPLFLSPENIYRNHERLVIFLTPDILLAAMHT